MVFAVMALKGYVIKLGVVDSLTVGFIILFKKEEDDT